MSQKMNLTAMITVTNEERDAIVDALGRQAEISPEAEEKESHLLLQRQIESLSTHEPNALLQSGGRGLKEIHVALVRFHPELSRSIANIRAEIGGKQGRITNNAVVMFTLNTQNS